MGPAEQAQGPGLGELGGEAGEAGGKVGRGHLDAAQSQAAGHSGLHILVLQLFQEAQQGLGKGGRANSVRDSGGTPASALQGGVPNSHPFPEAGAQRQAPELSADSSHDLVVAVDKQRAEGPESIPLKPPLRCQPQGLQHNSLVIRVQIPHQ